jgi:cytochrome P450
LDAIDRGNFYQDAASRWGPIFKMSQFHRPVACVTDLSIARAFLESQRESVRQVDWPFNRLVPGRYVEFMDGDRHARYRQLFQPGFGPDVLTSCRPHFAAAVKDGLQGMAQAADADGVAPLPYLEQIALATLVRMVLGPEAGDERVRRFPEWLAVLDRPIHILLPVPRSSRQAFRQLMGAIRAIGTEASQTGGRPLPPSVLGKVIEAGPELIHDDIVIGNLVTMIADGRNMLRMLLLWTTKLGADHSQWADRIRTMATTDLAAANALAHQFVLEVLRMVMSPYIYRKVIRDCRLGGYRIPSGWLVRICIQEAHHRADIFSRPEQFSPSRFADRSYGADEFWPFSAGAHACFADQFVMEVAAHFILELATGYNLQATRDGPLERGNRHWAYWLPSRHLRLRPVAVTDRDRSAPIATPPTVSG